MDRFYHRLLFAGIAFMVMHVSPSAQAVEPFDVVVYGGTSSGIIAAIQVQKSGKSVVLLEPSQHLGGLTTGGLGATDIGRKHVIGGLAREFYHRVQLHYRQDSAWVHETIDDYQKRSPRFAPGEETMWTFEPHVASQIFREMLAEAGIQTLVGQRLDRTSGVKLADGRIVSVTTESGITFAAKMFIDATYEGDLMAAAGVSYHVGRESNATYGETLNGFQSKNAVHHQFTHEVDPYIVPGKPASGLLWGIHQTHIPVDGTGDKVVQAYCFRLCTTDVPANRKPWPKPAEYDESRYELLLRNFEGGDHRVPWNPVSMPNRKTDTNNNYAFSTDYIGGNYNYPDADYATRERIIADHRNYQQGLLWTLANHARVPEKVREHYQRLGLSRDEFVNNDNWPTQLYIREARRMVSDYVMTEQNCRGERLADRLGRHGCLRDGQSQLPASRFRRRFCTQRRRHPSPTSPTPTRSAIARSCPKPYECTNLFAPVCVSSSHIGFGSIRMEPVFMVLGQSAAFAAVHRRLTRVLPSSNIDYPEASKDAKSCRPSTDARRQTANVSQDAKAVGCVQRSVTHQRPFLGACKWPKNASNFWPSHG